MTSVKWHWKIFLCFVIFVASLAWTEGAFKRCFNCRSRGDLGSCKDKFLYNNASALDNVQGVTAVPCTSGWCGKITEKAAAYFKSEDYGSATTRFCMQSAPPDNEERCATTKVEHKDVYLCFCQGDLCNGAPSQHSSYILMFTLPLLLVVYFGSPLTY